LTEQRASQEMRQEDVDREQTALIERCREKAPPDTATEPKQERELARSP
jgi:hypothetical protein